LVPGQFNPQLDPQLDPLVRGAPAPHERAKWGDLPRRAASTLLLVPLALLMMKLGGWEWSAATSIAGVALLVEWVQLCGFPVRRLPGALFVAGAALAWGVIMFGGASPPVILCICAAFLVITLWRPWLGMGLVYSGLSMWALIWLRQGEDGFANLLFLLPVVWASDIGAYTAGRIMDGPKLAPSISPQKTWSGSIGGLLAACLVGAAIAGGIAGDTTQAALIAVLLAAVSQIGDLAESWAKRRFGVKDSGTMIPGHGGVLDRLDGVMAASFFAVVLAALAGPGQYLWR